VLIFLKCQNFLLGKPNFSRAYAYKIFSYLGQIITFRRKKNHLKSIETRKSPLKFENQWPSGLELSNSSKWREFEPTKGQHLFFFFVQVFRIEFLNNFVCMGKKILEHIFIYIS